MPCAIPEVPELPESDLMCFPGKRRPAEVKSLLEYVSMRTRALKKDLGRQPSPGRNTKVRELRRLLRLPEAPVPSRCSAPVVGSEEGRRFEKFTVEEYCVSEGWIRVPAGKAVDRRGRPLLIKLSGEVEVWFKD